MDSFLFPKSFPSKDETEFLHMALGSDTDFPSRFERWSQNISFDDIDQATLRLLPLLYLRIQGKNIQNEISGKIKGVYRLTWVQNQRFLREVRRVCALLEENGIEVITMKGISMILDAYSDIGARWLGDADLFVSPNKIKETLRLLQDNGCTLITGQLPNFERLSIDSVQRVHREAHLAGKGGVELDVHWRIFEYSLGRDVNAVMPFNEVFKRSILMEKNGALYRVMGLEDLLLHVIVHGSQDNSHRTFRWVADAVTIIRNKKVNWDLFIKNTKKYEFEPEIYTSFLYMREQEFLNLPEKTWEQIFALKPSKRSMASYYKRSNRRVGSFSMLGGLPRLWKIYWKYESPGVSIYSIGNFFDYLSYAWGLDSKYQIVPFFFKKLSNRARYFSKKFA